MSNVQNAIPTIDLRDKKRKHKNITSISESSTDENAMIQALHEYQTHLDKEDLSIMMQYIISHFNIKYPDSRGVCAGRWGLTQDKRNPTRSDLNIGFDNKYTKVIEKDFSRFWAALKVCKRKRHRFLILDFGIYTKKEIHSNIVIYDDNNNVLLRIEPQGGIIPIRVHRMIDKTIKQEIIDKSKTHLKYYEPNMYCPRIGPQIYENMGIVKNSMTTSGLCFIFSIWFAELIIKNPERPPEEIKQYITNTIRSRKIPKKIRKYLVKLLRMWHEHEQSAVIEIS